MFPDFLDKPVDEAGKLLLGCILSRQLGNIIIKVRIVEVECYDQNDEASHTFRGKTKRNAPMFMGAGHLYVYQTYGMHYCCNIVTGRAGFGSGALIRAVEPITGQETIEQNRGVTGKNLTNGPAKTTQALGIDLRLKGHDLHNPPLQLLTGNLKEDEVILASPRIGISKAQHQLRRFFIANNQYVSMSKFNKQGTPI